MPDAPGELEARVLLFVCSLIGMGLGMLFVGTVIGAGHLYRWGRG